jgi:hypothetical protein
MLFDDIGANARHLIERNAQITPRQTGWSHSAAETEEHVHCTIGGFFYQRLCDGKGIHDERHRSL